VTLQRTNGGDFAQITDAVRRVRDPLRVLRDPATGEITVVAGEGAAAGTLVGWLPALYPEWLGDRAFQETHGVRYPYVTGSMANGIASVGFVVAMARAEMLGFFGAAGLSYERVESSIDEIVRALDGQPLAWGANLIHSPNEPALEERLAELYLRKNVPCVEASAFMGLTPALVRYAGSGLHVDATGNVARRRRVFAKISRPEIARRFMSPPPSEMLGALVASGKLTAEEARLAAMVPLATDITVEADSGGHTDNRPLVALLPAILTLRDEIEATSDMPGTIRVGAAGGLGTPASIAAAFSLGAAYVLTGSVNQAAIESGLSDDGRQLLAQAGIADVAMAAAADMFELGVKLQVLKRGTLFAARANKLYDVYRRHAGLEAIPAPMRKELEERILGATFDAVWAETVSFWKGREPTEVDRALADPKHRMALVFRWYLGKSSRWAISGDTTRRADYQIWCGPAMGAFNSWVKGSFLEDPTQRTAVQIALNLLEGAAVATRAQQLRTFGVAVPAEAFQFRPRRLA
jgi:trans-AT polyketide synthase, acyltransferase and oxidoreductase domains